MNETCGCCEGIQALTPLAIANRAGLDTLAYRVGTHASFLETMKKLQAQGAPLTIKTLHRVIGEGNFVLTQSEGESGGKPSAIYDLFRVEHGKIAEHWEVIQEIPAESKNTNGMF